MQPGSTSGLRRPSVPAPCARGRCLSALLSAFLLLAVPGLEAQEPGRATFGGEANVLAIDLPVAVRNAAGGVPGSLGPEDLEVLEDGEPRRVVGVARLGSAPGAEPWRLVIYLDLVLASPAAVKAAALNLAERAKELVALGTVEVMVADPEPTVYLTATRDPGLVESALARILIEREGRGEIDELRRGVLEAVAEGTALDSELTVVELARRAVEEEQAMVHRSQDHLLSWAAEAVGGSPRALFLVASGFDLDPGEFYRQRLGGARQLVSSSRELAASTEAAARALAACGWVVFPLAFTDLGAGPSEPSREFEAFRRRGLDGPRGDDSAMGGFTLPLGKKKEEDPEAGRVAAEVSLLLQPLPPLHSLAAATGGAAVSKAVGLPDVVLSLGRWFRVTFQVSRDLDGRVHPVEVRARGLGLNASSPRWVRSATPAVVAEARVRRILAGDYAVGDLAVAARFRREAGGDGAGLVSGILSVSLDLTGEGARLSDPARSALRLTVAYGSEGEAPAFQHELLKDQDLSGATWSHEKALSLPPSAEWAVVVIEDLLSGSWGARDLEP